MNERTRTALVAAAATLAVLGAGIACWLTVLPDITYGHEGQAYVEGAERIGQLLRGEAAPGQATGAQAAFSVHPHHAPLVKVVMGAAWAMASESRGGFGAISAGLIVVSLLSLLLTVRIGWAALGPMGGIAAGLLLLGSPRFVAYGATVSAEPVIALAWLVLLWTWHRSLETRAFVVPAALGVAVAFAADSQGVFLVIPALAYTWLVVSPPRATTDLPPGLVPMGAWPPRVLVSTFTGLGVAFAAWPWLRGEVGKKLVKYLFDPLSAPAPATLHGGVRFDPASGPDAPFGTALAQLTGRLPVAMVALALVGAVIVTMQVTRWRRAGLPLREGRIAALALSGLLLVTSLLITAVNGAPNYYKGIDRLVPLTPLVALLAAAGLLAAARAVVALLRVPARLGPAALASVVALAAAPGIGSTVRAGGEGVLWYGGLACGTGGALLGGDQLAADPLLPRGLLDFMNSHAGAPVALLPERTELERLVKKLKEDGVLAPGVTMGPSETAAFVVLVTAPQHPDWSAAVEALREREPVAIIEAAGVPYATVFAGP